MCTRDRQVSLFRCVCLVCLLTSQTGSLGSFIRSYRNTSAGNDSALQRLVLDGDSGDVFVAGRNVLLRLDTNLTVLQSTSLGPVCERTEAASARCSQTSDNDARLLLSLPGGERLLSCGTSEHGLCSVYDTRDLSGRPMHRASPLSHMGGEHDVVALFASGGSVGHEEQTLYVGHARDRRPATFSPPAFAALTIESDMSQTFYAAYRYDKTNIRSALDVSDEGRRHGFRFHFIHTFEHSGFVYFVTVQRNNTSSYVTKLARVCRGDVGFYSYTEVELG